ncbi:MAG: hypothetical protein HOY76_14410 [Streptomyces sp.]|nr:hypothetical protein [Streptomyces sp.]
MSQEPTPPPPVRQRNSTAYPFTFAETADHAAYTVLPGEDTEHPVLLDGWTALEDEPEKAPAADEAPQKTPRKRAAAHTDDQEGGEPR